jgi:hypothetical protein
MYLVEVFAGEACNRRMNSGNPSQTSGILELYRPADGVADVE